MNGVSMQVYNPFEFTGKTLQYVTNSMYSFLLDKKQSFTKRTAAKEAILKLEKLSEETKLGMVKKLDKISTKQVNLYNQQEMVSEFKSLFESKEFGDYKKIIYQIPQNQLTNFLHEVLVRSEGKLIEIRNYLSHYITHSKDAIQLNKLNALDQAIYQLILLTHELLKEIKTKKQKRLNNLVTHFIFLMIKTRAFTNKNISEQELYKTMSSVDSILTVENREEVKQYLFALTN